MIKHILPTPKKVSLDEGQTYVKAAVNTAYEPFFPRLAVFSQAAEKMLGIQVSLEPGGIRDVKELYGDFVARLTRMVLDMGRTPIVWEGFPKEGVEKIPRETIVIAWESYYHMVYDLLAAGVKVINAAWKPLYVVPSRERTWGPKELLGWNVYNWQHWWPNSSAFLNPIHVAPTEQVLGAQLCVWECTYEREILAAVNNATTLSERLWTVNRLWDDEMYFNRHDEVVRRLFILIAEQ